MKSTIKIVKFKYTLADGSTGYLKNDCFSITECADYLNYVKEFVEDLDGNIINTQTITKIQRQ